MPCCQHAVSSQGCPHEESHKPTDPVPEQEPTDDDSVPPDGVYWVIGMSAMKCRGHSTTWVSAGTVLPSPPLGVFNLTFQPIGWLVIADELASAVDRIPPDPPPRLAVA
jgi:hypothetical protein